MTTASTDQEVRRNRQVVWLSPLWWVGAAAILALIPLAAVTLRSLSLYIPATDCPDQLLGWFRLPIAVLFVTGAVLAFRFGWRAFVPAISLAMAGVVSFVLFIPVSLSAPQLDWSLKRPLRERFADDLIAKYRDSPGEFTHRIALSGSDRWLSETGEVVYVQAPGVRAVYFEQYANYFVSLIGEYYVSSDSSAPPPADGPHTWRADEVGGMTDLEQLASQWYGISAD